MKKGYRRKLQLDISNTAKPPQLIDYSSWPGFKHLKPGFYFAKRLLFQLMFS